MQLFFNTFNLSFLVFLQLSPAEVSKKNCFSEADGGRGSLKKTVFLRKNTPPGSSVMRAGRRSFKKIVFLQKITRPGSSVIRSARADGIKNHFFVRLYLHFASSATVLIST